jgi:hypothetical protein
MKKDKKVKKIKIRVPLPGPNKAFRDKSKYKRSVKHKNDTFTKTDIRSRQY